jgi:hypothetical protein
MFLINPYRFGAPATDPNFANVSLLLHGDGTNGSTTITDSSSSPKTVTAAGNAQISTAQSKFGGASIAFDGNEDYISSASNAAFSFGTGNFTIEGWYRFNSISDQLLYDTIPVGGAGARNSGFAWALQAASGKLNFFSGASFRGASSSSLSSGQWYHLALVRNGSEVRYFINGAMDATTFTASTNFTDSTLLVGRVGDSAAYYLNGYIDDLRITKGVARYTANFTPPTAPFPDS